MCWTLKFTRASPLIDSFKVYCKWYGKVVNKVYCKRCGKVVNKVYCKWYGKVVYKVYCKRYGKVVNKVYCKRCCKVVYKVYCKRCDKVEYKTHCKRFCKRCCKVAYKVYCKWYDKVLYKGVSKNNTKFAVLRDISSICLKIILGFVADFLININALCITKLREWQQLSKMSKLGISQKPWHLGNFLNA